MSGAHEYPTRNQSNIYLKKCKYSSTQNNFEYVWILRSEMDVRMFFFFIDVAMHCNNVKAE